MLKRPIVPLAKRPGHVPTLPGLKARELVKAEGLPNPRLHKNELKHLERLAMQKESVAKTVPALSPGDCWHIVSNGSWDYWRLIPLIIERHGPASRLTASTWVMSRRNVDELCKLMQAGQIGHLDLVVGEHFKNTAGAPYATLVHGLAAFPGRWRMFSVQTHAKIAVVESEGYCIVVEGSANWTANPRIENNIIAWDAHLGSFHKSWISELLEGTDGTK